MYSDEGMPEETMIGLSVMINISTLREGACFFITGWVVRFLHRSHTHGRARFNQTHTDGVRDWKYFHTGNSGSMRRTPFTSEVQSSITQSIVEFDSYELSGCGNARFSAVHAFLWLR
jgi:hypothetical protein